MERKKVANMMKALTMLAVSGQWSSRRSEATLERVGVRPRDACVRSGITRCSAAQARKRTSKATKTRRILFTIVIDVASVLGSYNGVLVLREIFLSCRESCSDLPRQEMLRTTMKGLNARRMHTEKRKSREGRWNEKKRSFSW